MGLRVIYVMGFLPANLQLARPFHSQLRVRHVTDKKRMYRETTAIDALCPTLWGYISFRFNGHFPGGPVLVGTRMSLFWISLELRVMEVVSGDIWSYKTCKAPVKMSSPTNQNPVFTGQMPFVSPNQQCRSTEGDGGIIIIIMLTITTNRNICKHCCHHLYWLQQQLLTLTANHIFVLQWVFIVQMPFLPPNQRVTTRNS